MTSNKLSAILIIAILIIIGTTLSFKCGHLKYIGDVSITDRGDTLIIHRGLSNMTDLMLVNNGHWYLYDDTNESTVDEIEIIRNEKGIKSIRFSVGDETYSYSE